jgi:3-oxoacyl-[acyl-carrier protein] reductase
MSATDLLDLGGQAALITGAGQGAGRAMALTFAQHNAAVAVNDYVLERAEAVAGEIRAAGGKAVAVQADVGDLASVTAAFAAAREALGPITLLVNNAGMAGPTGGFTMDQTFWQADPAEWANYINTNLYGVMNCCYVGMPDMVAAKRGRIITVVSDAGRIGEPRLVAYSGAKAGAAGFMRSLAREAARYNVTCNNISLSSQEPAIWTAEGWSEERKAEWYASDAGRDRLQRYPLKRLGKPKDVAAMALFLCSDAAEWVTGQTIPVNGGYSFTQ